MLNIVLNILLYTAMVLIFMANIYISIVDNSWINAIASGYMLGAFTCSLMWRKL